uniref:Uncharacterized protein n=1 Tax=viral metagenome TaxID=1070528 RepID=A0A6C0KLX7_9ZZZZ
MPALQDTLGDPCSLLNTASYPSLWISDKNASSTNSDATVFPLIASRGLPVTYLSAILGGMNTTGGTSTMLKTLEPNSESSLVQFLSGGGITSIANGGADFTQFQNIVLYQMSSAPTKTAATPLTQSVPVPETIVDTYIVTALGKKYTYSTTDMPIMQPTDFWAPSDITPEGGIVTSPKSLLGMLLGKGYLLQQKELFNPSEFTPNAPLPPPGTESLVYLYQLSQKPGYTLTKEQANRVMVLEAKNLRFFGAFLAEYCYYRTRYEWLLQKYFAVYKQQSKPGSSSAYIPPVAGSPVFTSLFNGQGTGDNQYTSSTALSQTDYLKGITYHLACLNTRMTDLRMLLGTISNYYENVLNQIQMTVNSQDMPGSNKDLVNKIIALNESADKAQDYMTERDFHQGIMEYNAEKNRYSNILLGLYAFLNISAVAVILQLSRS